MSAAPAAVRAPEPADARRPVATGRGRWSVPGLVAFVLACGAVALLLRIPYLEQPLDRDTALYAAIGDRLGLHTLPYRDLFDHKQPLPHYLYWVIQTIAPASVLAVRLAAVLVAAAVAVVVGTCLVPLVGFARAMAAAALASVLMAAPGFQGGDLNTEHILQLTAALAVLPAFALGRVHARWFPAAIGLLAGLAALSKAVGALPALAALVPLIAGRRFRGQTAVGTALLFGAGAALPAGVIAVWYAGHGALGDLWLGNVAYNRQYVAIAPRNWWPDDESILFLVGAALLVGGLRLVALRGRDALAPAFGWWLVTALVGAQLAGRYAPHYYVPLIVPAVCLLVLPIPLARPALRVASTTAAAVLAVGAGLVYALPLAGYYGKSGSEVATKMYRAEAVHWHGYFAVRDLLRGRARPDDTLFVAGGEPGYYWTTRLRAPGRLMFDYPVRVWPERFEADMRDALCASRPEFVALPGGVLPPYAADCIKAADYRKIGDVRYVAVFERRTR